MATLRDLEEVVEKLSSDRARTRDEGVKLLGTWLQGDRARTFCRLLARNTARSKPGHLASAVTWPLLILAVAKCVIADISAKKRGATKSAAAKMLRVAIQCAEDVRLSGNSLLLISVAKQLFSHVWEVVKDAPIFQLEYIIILRQLLTVKEYRYQMKPRTYSSFVMLYMKKVVTGFDAKFINQASSKEESFRCTVTLHILLENPPGDYPDSMREEVLNGLCVIFSHIREEGKLTRKLMECINTFLLKDGPNLGDKSVEIHNAVQDFIFHSWLTTHDRALKSLFITYAKVQLKLARAISEILEKLIDVIIKELDQNINTGAGLLWCEAPRDEKAGSWRCFQEELMDLSATVFYLAYKCAGKTISREKRLKTEHVMTIIMDGLFKGSLSWSATVCFLIHKYGYRLDKSLLISCFEATCKSLKSALTSANAIRLQDSLLWLIRTLKEFSALLITNAGKESQILLTDVEMSFVEGYWQDIWNSLIHALPLFSTTALIADSALSLLGGMIVRDQVHTSLVSEDTWDLQTFKQFPSSSALYFIACYFSRIGFQGDLSNSIFVRKNLLKSTLELVHSKDFSLLNEQNVVIIPEAIFSLCAGFSSSAIIAADTPQLFGECKLFSKLLLEDENMILKSELGYSVEALSEINLESATKVMSDKCNRAHLPGHIQQQLLLELMEITKGFMTSNEKFEEVDFSNLIHVCSLLCNLIHCALLSRAVEEKSSFLQAAFDYVTNIIKHIISRVTKRHSELSHGLTNAGSAFESNGSSLSSFQTLLSSPIFRLRRVNKVSSELIKIVTELLDELLVAISELFSRLSVCMNSSDGDNAGKMLPISCINLSEDLNPIIDHKSSVVDMDLDVTDSGEVDSITATGSGSIGNLSRPLDLKLEIVGVISTFFSVSPLHTWEVLYNLVEKESDVKICQAILLNLCENISASSKSLSSLVHLVLDMRDRCASSPLSSADCLAHVHALLRTLIDAHDVAQNTDEIPQSCDVALNENQEILSDLVNKATETKFAFWFFRIKLIDCISHFIYLFPDIAQDMTAHLLNMLHDTDYRVRLYLARKIVVLFQMWEGHIELFHDVCSYIGAKMVRFSNEIPVKARELLAVGPQPVPVLETVLITLAHLSLHSEDVEVECAFMISVVAAIEPSHRELAYALFDSISRRLGYASRSRYLDQLVGPILFRWVACEVSLVSLVEVQEMFGFTSAVPKNFIEHIGSWLLPFLMLRGDAADLNWISKIMLQPLSTVIKGYFVPIFGLCIAARCGSGPEKDLAETVLFESLLRLGEISELERDDLIKKHMVSIVGFLLSVSATARQTEFPYFSREIVAFSVKTVVDGFVDTADDDLSDTVVIDKINIFRPDRVFKFLLAIHQQVADAGHPRHVGHRLCAIEVLIDVLGHRVVQYSTCFYIICIVGNYIWRQPLQAQCCNILSKLLAAFGTNSSTETFTALGLQLQLLVPKLVTCCLPNDKEGRSAIRNSSRVISLLRQLTVDADPLLYDYIRDLEPFPSLDCLKDIQVFHASLSDSYASREQFLKFVDRAPHLPPQLFLLSLRMHHKKLLLGQIIGRGDVSVGNADSVSCWRSDPEVVSAVWTLVDLCSSLPVANEASSVLADFISRAGISDAHQVIFRVPTQKHPLHLYSGCASKEDKICSDYGISDDILVGLLKLLKTYLSDESAEIIDVTSRTLRGVLSTSKGLNALQCLDSLDRSLLMVHSRGINIQLVEQTLLGLEKYSGVSLEDSDIWQTDGRTYEQWLCTLVSSLICHCDIILRLCRSLVFLKVEAAELLLASALVNIAGNVDSNSSICGLISSKVEKIILCDSNHLMKSVNLFLDALNVVRSFYVAEKARTLPSNTQKDGRSVRSKSRSPATTPSSSWKKVYWLSVDYLVTARAAKRCSCDFATVMYVELWCEEQFNKLALGPSDFSQEESLPAHIGLLAAAYTQINEPDSIYGITLANEVQEMFGFTSAVPKNFIEHIGSWLLPFLMLRGDAADLNWISKIMLQPLSTVIKGYFVPIFGLCIAARCGSGPEKDLAETVLFESLLRLGEISELERDDLIKKHMVSIVGFLLSVSATARQTEFPYFSREIVAFSVKTVVDGFVDTADDDLSDTVVIDKINIFRPDRVFKFLLAIHQQVADAGHPRHVGHRLCAIEVLIDVLGHRVVQYSTCFYIICIVGNYIWRQPLQAQCCNILSKLLAAFGTNSSTETFTALGLQLQLLVPKLVTCCLPNDKEGRSAIRNSSRVISLLRQLTVDADPLLYDYIRDLEPFPSLDCLKDIQVFHASLSDSYASREQFLKFVDRAPHLPPQLFLLSLRMHHKKLLLGQIIGRGDVSVGNADSVSCWRSDPEVVSAVWTLVDLCSSLPVANEASSVLADFISRAGISDAHQVIFRVPTQKHPLHLYSGCASKEDKICSDYGISDDILVGLLKLLKTYLSDESAEIIDVTSRTLRGVLSTSKGLNALQCLDSLDRSLLMVHSRGINIQLVEQTLLGLEKYSGVSLEDSDIWQTDGRTYEQWLCTLVSSLICHCDIILRLCRSLVFLKVEAAELLLASALVNIAGNVDSNSSICGLISSKVEKIILCDSNHLMKSVNLFLDALNVVRSFYVAEKARTLPSNTQKDGRSVRSKSRSPATTPSSSWKKVYWLSVDYLVTARAAKRCSCDFATVMYVELWCEEQFNKLALGPSDFSQEESLPAHIGLLAAAYTQINEPDSIYGITLANEISSQIIRYEHEGDWSSALEYYDLLVRSTPKENLYNITEKAMAGPSAMSSKAEENMQNWKMHKGLMRSLQKTGCSHVLDLYCQGLTNQKACLQQDSEFIDIQYEAAWRAGNWDFSFFVPYSSRPSSQSRNFCLLNENLHSCLRALQNGDAEEFRGKLCHSKMDLVLALSSASKESTKYIHSTVLKLQMLDHLTMVWDLRWTFCPNQTPKFHVGAEEFSPVPAVPTKNQLELLNKEWNFVLCQTERNLDLFEPFLAFRRVLLKILGSEEHIIEHLFQSASALRKGSRFSLAAAALYELKELCCHRDQRTVSNTYFLSKLEEAKLLRAQGQHDMAISLGKYILQNHTDKKDISDVYRLVGKWLAETRSSNSRTIIEDYLRHSVDLAEFHKSSDRRYMSRQCRTYFHLAHYTDGLFKSYEERLSSNEWQAALRLRKYKTRELETLIKRLKSSSKGEKTDYSVKIQELQKQLALDREEAQKIQDDRDKFLSLALQGYQRSLVVGGKYDLQVVFRLVSLWFSLFSREQVVKAMMKTTKEVQTYKFIPLVYQIASRLGSSKDAQGSTNFQNALASLLKKMAVDHPYHTVFQLLALANGDRVKDKQRSRSSFVVDMDKKLAAENLLKELSSFHGALIRQMKQMVEIYIKLAELETKKEDTNKKIPLPRELRSVRQLELVPVVTATIPVDPDCRYEEGSFPHFNGLVDSIMVMNGINAPKVIECIGSDGNKYRQLAKSGNDDLRQDAVMEQFFSLVNMFLQNHRDTSERRLRIRTYKVVPFTPSAGVVEWVDGTVPLGEYLLGSTRIGGAHGRYGTGDWTYLQCREYMMSEKDKRRAFLKVCDNFRPVMHHFFLERFLRPADWFQSRLAYTRSVAASSMVGYIVGLGDRHSMNVLIDQDTAEVVHIDLGVAFEQGLMLKTPERVPFRLTRDIIDGMGVTGIEGVFRRCCEKTLSVMRANKEALLTIIEVFIHDPLYKWALSPLKALQRQKETDDTDSCLDDSQEAYDGNKDAARAILRVKQKLDGYEDGEMRSVQGQVRQLIQDAVDIDRLCQMFPGWGPWL